MKKHVSFILFAVVIIVFTFAAAVQAKPFYEGKVIKIIVATKPGGGYDYYGRLMAQFMHKHLPGSTIIVKNMPGAGHVIGTNATYRSKPNGLTIGTFNRAVGMTQVAGMKGVKFDFSKFKWLGSPSTELYSFIVNSKKYKSLDEVLNADNVRLATTGLGSISYLTPLLFYQMLGKSNYSIGTGYSGGETEMAVMRLEMDGTWGSFWSRKSMVDNDYGRVVVFIGTDKPSGQEHVPFIQDVIKDEKHKPVIDLLAGLNLVGRPFALPPKVPADRVKILQDAFNKACHDPELLKLAKKNERPIDFVSPKEVEAWAGNLLHLPVEMVATIKKAYGVK